MKDTDSFQSFRLPIVVYQALNSFRSNVIYKGDILATLD